MRDLILHNFRWKVFSLLLAGLAWFTIHTSLREDLSQVVVSGQRSFQNIPVILLTSVKSTSQFVPSPDTVEVAVSGSEAELEKLKDEDVRAFVDVTRVKDEKEVRRKIQVQVPGKCQVVGVNPLYASVARITASH
jgi:hypothetical protein